jgi:hypothetical protein
MAVFAFFFPGILLLFSRAFNKRSLSEMFVLVIGASLAFFVVSPWLIKLIHLSLASYVYFIFIITSIALIVLYKRAFFANITSDNKELIIILIFAAVIMLRCLPMYLQIAPSGADMSMHTYIARLIYDNDGLPNTYEPLLPISEFGAYPTGFPTLSAIISLVSLEPIHRSSLLVTCLTHALITLGLFVFLLNFFDRNVSIAAALGASFLTRSPQWIIRWGGNPTVLALFFFILCFALIIEMKKGFSNTKLILASLFLAATLITHSIIFYAGCFFLLAYLLASLRDMPYIKNILKMGPIFLLMSAPYLINIRPFLSAESISSVRAWQVIDLRSVLYDLAGGVFFFLPAFFGMIVMIIKNKKTAMMFLMLSLVVALLTINYRFWLLPASYLLYPGRVFLLMIIPFSVFFAAALTVALGKWRNIFVPLFSCVALVAYIGFYVFCSVSMTSVTPDDMEAFKWIDKTISKNAVFINNYGDAGLWIPAIVGRKITVPHSEPVHLAELQRNLKLLKPNYIYIGGKQVYGIDVRKEDLEKRPYRYKRVYMNGSAQVWKIL